MSFRKFSIRTLIFIRREREMREGERGDRGNEEDGRDEEGKEKPKDKERGKD